MFKKESTKRIMTRGACFIMVMISLGFTSSTKSLFPDEIAKALDTERSLVSIGESCRYIATAIVNIFFGFLVVKFGAKKLVLFGFISLIASMSLYSIANNLVVIYIAGALLGVGLSFTATTMVGYVVGKWCTKNKGTIMGAVLAANGIGGAIAIQIAGGLIDPEVVGSYRAAYRMIAIVLAIAAVIIMLLMREKKDETETSAEKAKPKKAKRGESWVGMEFSDAIKKWYFWGALVCIFLSGFILQGTHSIVAMHYKDVGIDYAAVKSFLSFSSLILVSAKFLTGFIYDRAGLRITASICIFTGFISTVILALTSGNATGFTLAIIFAVISPYSMPLETVMLPIYANDLFGEKAFSKALGIFVSVNTAGYAVGAPVLNLCFDIFGSYVPALLITAGLMFANLILVQFVISAAHKGKVKIESEI